MKGEMREGKGAVSSIHVCVGWGCQGLCSARAGGTRTERGEGATNEAAQPSKTIPTHDPPLGA